jgi:hypothetical protein
MPLKFLRGHRDHHDHLKRADDGAGRASDKRIKVTKSSTSLRSSIARAETISQKWEACPFAAKAALSFS